MGPNIKVIMRNILSVVFCLVASPILAQGTVLPPSVQGYVDYLVQSCSVMQGEFTSGPGLVTQVDLDQDGTQDYIVDGAGAQCSTSKTLYCDAGIGCEIVTFVGDTRHGTIVLDWAVVDLSGKPALRVKQAGLLLNLPEDRVSDLVWDRSSGGYIEAAY